MNCRRPGIMPLVKGSSVCLFLFFLFLADSLVDKAQVNSSQSDDEIKDFGGKSDVYKAEELVAE
jgi:hypothetical protein